MHDDHWEQAWAARDRDPALAEQLAAHAPDLSQAQVIRAYLHWRAGQLRTAQDTLAPALTTLKQQAISVWYGRALNTAACLAYTLNQADEALIHLEEQINVGRILGDVTLEAIGLHDLACMLRPVHPTRAEQYLREALALFEIIDEPLGQPLAYVNLGGLEQDAGRAEAALNCYLQALQCPGLTLQPMEEASTLSSIISILDTLSRPEEGQFAEVRLQELADANTSTEVQAEVWLSLTRHALPEEVIARLAELPAQLAQEGNHFHLPTLYERLSEAHAQLGDYAGALSALQASVRYERAAHFAQRQYVTRAFESLLVLEETRRHNTVLKRHAEQLERLSQTDHLTGLANRLALFKQAQQWAADQQELSVALFDIDGFKQINDTWGHLVGDVVLTRVAHILQMHAEASDIVARYGGEEFIVVRTSPLPLLPTCQSVLEAVRGLKVDDWAPGLKVTLSAGIAGQARDFHQLLETADAKLYSVKHSGKNAVAS